jgi:NTP pyrophosphatase (non-canonical NTP hydrolase)
MPDSDTTLLALRGRIATFVEAREWEAFHNPKDLASAIAIEAAELTELFLWKGLQQVDELTGQRESRHRIEEELADIVILCLSLANHLEIDVADAVMTKVDSNETKYPTELARGKAYKYTHYATDP